MSDDGQISEVHNTRPEGAAQDDPPGTNDGVPPADAARQEAQGGPREYGEGVMGDE